MQWLVKLLWQIGFDLATAGAALEQALQNP